MAVARPATPSLAVRALVTIGVALFAFFGQRVRAPGIDEHAFDAALVPRVLMLGLAPVVSAYLLVEVVAALVPRWRALRHAGIAARAKLDFAVGIAAVVLATIQAFSIALRFAVLESAHPASAAATDMAVLVLTLVAGTFVLWVVARTGTRFGLVNGYALMLGVASLPDLFALIRAALVTDDRAGEAMLLSSVLLATVASLAAFGFVGPGRRAPWIPVPSAGLQPHVFVGASAVFPAMPSRLFDAGAWVPPSMALAVVSIVGVWGMSTALFRPMMVARDLKRFEQSSVDRLASTTRDELRRSLRMTVVFLLALQAAYWGGTLAMARVVARSSDDVIAPRAMLSIVIVPLTIALFLDIGSALRAHASDGRLVCVWEERRAHMVFALRDRLAAEGIAVHVRGAYCFSLFQFFGPFVPAELWVTTKEASGAREWLADALEDDAVIEPPDLEKHMCHCADPDRWLLRA